jgi:large subunit ribosomal protein L25
MSEQVNLNAENREVEGKSSSRQLRRAGSVPAVIYGGKEEPLRISILEKDIAKASEVPGFATQILNISISGKEQNVIVKEIQRHPATMRVLHADLMRVDPDTKISISVPVRFINEDSCVGVKMHGGVVSHLINDIDITCLASNLPEYLEVDVEAMDIGDSIFLSALNLPEGVEIPSLALGEDRDQAVVSVAEAKILEIEPEVVEPEEGEEGEEGAEGEESAEGEASSGDSGGDSKDSEENSE